MVGWLRLLSNKEEGGKAIYKRRMVIPDVISRFDGFFMPKTDRFSKSICLSDWWLSLS